MIQADGTLDQMIIMARGGDVEDELKTYYDEDIEAYKYVDIDTGTGYLLQQHTEKMSALRNLEKLQVIQHALQYLGKIC